MKKYEIAMINDTPQLIDVAAEWFGAKWNVPVELYKKSMVESITSNASIPKWFIMMENSTIVGGVGIIENDFHPRQDLTPNICALYVEPAYRKNGLATQLLNRACDYLSQQHYKVVYLLTDLESFYETKGWIYLESIEDNNEDKARIYEYDLQNKR